jgi:hypothetical protein
LLLHFPVIFILVDLYMAYSVILGSLSIPIIKISTVHTMKERDIQLY